MIDLYCGVGLFTLPLAKEHGWAMGVELVDSAIQRAKKSAASQNIHAEFVSGDVFEQLDVVDRKLNSASFLSLWWTLLEVGWLMVLRHLWMR